MTHADEIATHTPRTLLFAITSAVLACPHITGCSDNDDPLNGNGADAGPESPVDTDLAQWVVGTDPVVRYGEMASACLDGGVPDSPLADLTPRPLRESGHLVGVAVDVGWLDDPTYATAVAHEFNYITAENEMKWGSTGHAPDGFDFAPADKIVAFAAANEMKVKGHTLIWHNQLPTWVEELQGAEAVRDAMARHIEEVVGHFRDRYPGTVVAWDAVNEALENDGQYRSSVFYRNLGEAYIAEAFQMARAADPAARLLYNDYGIEDLGPKSDAAFEMIRSLLEAGVPVDGIGFQMHTSAAPRLSRTDFEQNLARYAALGITVNISEMDATCCYGFESPEEALAAQRQRYNEIVGTCLLSGACESVTVWGLTDRQSWLNERRNCDPATMEPWPLLFDDDYNAKPAWWGMFDALNGCFDWTL